MRIDAVDFFYLSMPEVADIGDGSQDMLLVRVRADSHTGWGECEAAPLVSIASLVCPMSHSACKPVLSSVLGQRLDSPADIGRIGDLVRANSLDLLQADHTWSGIDIALWDLLGKKEGAPVFHLLGYGTAFPKLPYASQLFGDTAEETGQLAAAVRRRGFLAAKFGWGPFGRGSPNDDAEQVRAARDSLGPDLMLMVDAGTVWREDVEAAALRLDALAECQVTWLEEPFVSGALESYRRLAEIAEVKLAAGEGAHTYHLARTMIDHASLGFVQIDAGRVGGITVAKQVADYAEANDVRYVNHTFTSHLALSASLQPYAGLQAHELCEYPAAPAALAMDVTTDHLIPAEDGYLRVPERPGLGLTVQPEVLGKYLVEVEISVNGKKLYETPSLTD